MIDVQKRYAICFPELQPELESVITPSIFTEKSINRFESILTEAHEAMGGLLGYIAEKYTTKQLEKQIASAKEGLDVITVEKQKQLAINTEEEVKRLKIAVEKNKKNLKLKMKNRCLEIKETAGQFKCDFEEVIKSDQLFMKLIKDQMEIIKEYNQFIEKEIFSGYHHCKHYIIYCDLQKRSINQINFYLNAII